MPVIFRLSLQAFTFPFARGVEFVGLTSCGRIDVHGSTNQISYVL